MIPIEFKAEAWSGPASVNCLGEEEERSPNICCGKGERIAFDNCEKGSPHVREKRSTSCFEREERKDICCERECTSRDPDFYYYVKGKRGRLKK